MTLFEKRKLQQEENASRDGYVENGASVTLTSLLVGFETQANGKRLLVERPH